MRYTINSSEPLKKKKKSFSYQGVSETISPKARRGEGGKNLKNGSIKKKNNLQNVKKRHLFFFLKKYFCKNK